MWKAGKHNCASGKQWKTVEVKNGKDYLSPAFKNWENCGTDHHPFFLQLAQSFSNLYWP